MPLSFDPLFVPATGLSSLTLDFITAETLNVSNALVVQGVAQFTQFGQGVVQSSGAGILTSSYTINGNVNSSYVLTNFANANIASNLILPNMFGDRPSSKPLKLDATNMVVSGNISQSDVQGLPEEFANIQSNIGNLQGNLNEFVRKTGDTMTGTLEIVGGSLAVKDTNTPPNYGGYVQITPNVGGLTKIYHSGDRGLDIDGQLANHRLRMTGFANVTVDNPMFINASTRLVGGSSQLTVDGSSFFKGTQFLDVFSVYQTPASGNIRTASSTGDSYVGTANVRIEGDPTTLKPYTIGHQYPFSKVQSFQPIEVNTINAIGNTLYIANDNSTDEVQIAVGSNVHVVNILTGGGFERDTLNIGSGNTQINFFGNTFYNFVEDHRVVDREIILNANAVGSGTSGLCGLWIRDNNFDAYNYFVVNSDRDGYLFRGGADPAFSNTHVVNLKCVNISGSSGKFLTCVDTTNTTTLQSGNILKADLPASVAFLDNDQTFTGNQTYNCPTLTCNPLTELFVNQISSTNPSTFNVAFNSNVAITAGSKISQPSAPTVGNDLTNKTYCDGKVLKSGDTMTGSLNLNAVNPLIVNTDNAILLPRRQTGSNPQFITFQNSDGSASYAVVESAGSAGSSAFGTTGSYDFNIGSYTLGGDVNIFQQGTIGGIKMKIGFGNTRSYNPIDMLNNKITNLGNATLNSDAVNKIYVDTTFAPNSYVNSTFASNSYVNNTFAPNTYVNNQLALKYDKTGGTISGQVIVDNARLYVQRDGGNVYAGPYGDYQGNGTLFITGKTNTDRRIAMGIDQTNDLYIIQAIEAGINIKTLSLNPSGGLVSIGSGGISCNYTPTTSTNLTTKAYVDSLVSGNVSALLSSNNTWTGNNTFNGATTTIGTSSKLVVDNIQSSNPTNLNIQFNSNTAFINNRIVQIDPLAETGLVIFGGNIAPAGANPTTISGADSFGISQVKSGSSDAGVYLQTWNSRVLYLNSLGGNDVTVGSQGGGAVNLNCWNNIRAYNKGNGGQYIQSYINTSDSNRGYLESVGTNITISASPSNTYNCIFKNLTLVQIGGAGSTIPLHTYGQNTMYDGANTGAYWQFNPTNGLIYNGGQSTTWDGQSQAGVNYNINNYASFNTNTPFVSTSAGNNISLRRNNDSTSPAKMVLTNNAGSTTYGVVGIEDSSGGDILSGSTANSLVIGTPSNTNFFFIQNNTRSGIYRGNQWLYNKMDRPHMCWANNPEGNEGGNKLQVRYIKYSGSWPTTPTITSSDNYTQTIALDTLYTIITSSTSYIAMVAGTLNINSSGWYNITITYGQYLQGQIGRNSIYAIAGNATEEPFYCLSGDILFFEIYDWMANTGTSRTFSFKISQIYGI